MDYAPGGTLATLITHLEEHSEVREAVWR